MADRGRPAWEPTEEERKLASDMAEVGITFEQIAKVLKVSSDTLVKYLGEVLHVAKTKANMKVSGALYQKAIAGNVTAAIYITKTQMGWRESGPVETDVTYRIELRRGADRKSVVTARGDEAQLLTSS